MQYHPISHDIILMEAKTELLSFPIHGDSRGSLIALECFEEIPFAIKRIYYIFGTQKNTPRGFHAHKELKQILISVSGSATIHCEQNSCKRKYFLNSPDKGLLIEGLVWREMHDFSPDCVLLVLANQHYDENDYIRSYEEFLKIVLQSLNHKE